MSKNDQAVVAIVYETGLVMNADRLRGILDLIEESLDEPGVAGSDLAGSAYLSRFYFDRLVRACAGYGLRACRYPTRPILRSGECAAALR